MFNRIGRWTATCALVVVLVMLAATCVAIKAASDWKEGVGIVSSIGTIVGVPFLVVQIITTRTAALAATEATERAIKETKKNRHQYMLQHTSRLLSNLRLLVAAKKWSLASLRCDDLADAASQLAYVWRQPDQNWWGASSAMRAWAIAFQNGRTNAQLAIPQHLNWQDWESWCVFIQTRIDIESNFDPFM